MCVCEFRVVYGWVVTGGLVRVCEKLSKLGLYNIWLYNISLRTALYLDKDRKAWLPSMSGWRPEIIVNYVVREWNVFKGGRNLLCYKVYNFHMTIFYSYMKPPCMDAILQFSCAKTRAHTHTHTHTLLHQPLLVVWIPSLFLTLTGRWRRWHCGVRLGRCGRDEWRDAQGLGGSAGEMGWQRPSET